MFFEDSLLFDLTYPCIAESFTDAWVGDGAQVVMQGDIKPPAYVQGRPFFDLSVLVTSKASCKGRIQMVPQPSTRCLLMLILTPDLWAFCL